MDMEGLVDSMHKNGINLRYLGYIHTQLQNTQNHYFLRLIERSILVRSIVKILRKISLEVNSETIISLFLRLANIVLGSKDVRDYLDGVKANEKNSMNGNENLSQNKKTKKNKKKKNKKK